jgi:hypothetical protein
MKFVNLQSKFPLQKVESNLKRAPYYVQGEQKFTEWSLADFDKTQKGIHVSYNEEKKKLTIYNEDGESHKDFIAPITEIFTGKISEKNGVTHIKGRINMSPIFNIVILLVFIGLFCLYTFLDNQRGNIAVIFLIFLAYFILVKKARRTNMDMIAIFLDSITYAQNKPKKNNPNKKKGKWAGKHY